MNLATLSGVYENSRTLSRALGDGTHLQDRVTRILNNPAARQEFVEALNALEGHLRVMGFEEIVQVAVVNERTRA